MSKVISIALALMFAAAGFFGIWYLNKERQNNELVWAEGERSIEHDRKSLPLKVFVDQSFGSAHTESADQAIGEWNRSTCIMMVRTYELELADIHIQHEPCDKDSDRVPNHPGCTWLVPKTGRIIIQVGQPGDVTMSYLIFFHEVTHAFGLAHDGIYRVPEKPENSLLFIPITANNAWEHSYRLGYGQHLPRLSDKDEAAVKKRYCN